MITIIIHSLRGYTSDVQAAWQLDVWFVETIIECVALAIACARLIPA